MRTAALALCLLILSGSVPVTMLTVRASSSVNIINNPSFEEGVDLEGVPVGWDFETCEGVANATVSIDSSLWVDGSQSVKVFSGPITNTYCFPPDDNATRFVGFTQFRQFKFNASGLTFADLTDSPGGFSFWFYLQPYGSTTMGGFSVRVFGAESTAELDYVFSPHPDLKYINYSYPNGEGFRALIFDGYEPGQWHFFSRNLRADWAGLGLNLTRSFSWVQFQGMVLQSGDTLHSETFWLDDVRVYVGSTPPPTTTHWTIFNFTDTSGNIIDSIIKWGLFNQAGEQVAYTLGESTLPDGAYFLEAYYRAYGQPFLVLREQIHLDRRFNVSLALYPNTLMPGGYVVFDSPVTSASVEQTDTSRLHILVQGTVGRSYRMLLDIPTKPYLVQANGVDLVEGANWSYEPQLSLTRINFVMLSGVENFTLFLTTPPRMPALSFVDVYNSFVDAKVSFKILDSQGIRIPYLPGNILPPGNFFLEAYFEGYTIYRSPLNPGTIETVKLQMYPLTSARDSYLALNSSANSLIIIEASSSKITFQVSGSGPYLIILNVPSRALYVERNGVRTASWIYNSTSQTIAIETDTEGTFQLVFNEPPSDQLYLVGVAGVTVAGLAAMYTIGRRLRNSRREVTHDRIHQQRQENQRQIEAFTAETIC